MRERTAVFAAILLMLLAITATIIAVHRENSLALENQRLATWAQAQWDDQPDRHPHRVVHFGDFVFKPLSPLAQFDWGVEAYTGHVLFLEGHRQNTANFSEATQSSALLRFGFLTPAFIFQLLLPLLIIFFGYSAVASDRESGLLRQMVAMGMSARAYLFGQWLALALPVLSLMLCVLVTGYSFTASSEPELLTRSAFLMAAYFVYLCFWCAIVVLFSTWVSNAYTALLLLVVMWIALCVAMPRIAPELAQRQFSTMTRVETEMRADKEIKSLGDSHNPNDPHFAQFKEKTLRHYGVSRVEDLPINYGGLLMQEGERLTSTVYQKRNAETLQQQHEQNRWVDHWSWVNPYQGLLTVSRAAAGVDFLHYRHFLDASEKRRYEMIQALNKLHTEKIKFENDRLQLLDKSAWSDIPRTPYVMPSITLVKERIVEGLAALSLWLFIMCIGMLMTARKIERLI